MNDISQGVTAPRCGNSETQSSNSHQDCTIRKDDGRPRRPRKNMVVLDNIYDNEPEIAGESSGCPGISFSKKNEIIQIYRTTITALHNPRAICFLFHPDKKEMAVASCATDHRDGIKVPEFEDAWDGFRINSKPVLDMLWHHCGWKDDETYRIMGEKIPGYKLVRFRLEEAEIVSIDQVQDGSFPVVE